MVRLMLAVALSMGAVLSMDHRPVPEFEINLDNKPEERFAEVLTHFKPAIHDFIKYFFADGFLVKSAASAVALARGRETKELQQELKGYAKYTDLTKHEIHLINLLMELTTIMVPIVNFTQGSADMNLIQGFLGKDFHFPAPDPLYIGCMGIVAKSDEDGTVYHSRNLDLPFSKILQPMIYTGIFTKGGSEIFRAQMIAAYDSVLTAMRKGPNGYAVEINTRFPDHFGGNTQMLERLFLGKIVTSGFSKRKILETVDNYEDAVEAFSTTPYGASEFNVVSGVKKGTILARNPDGLAYQLPLSESKKKYIIMTNFDYIWGDIRENFDPSGGDGFFHPRRKGAEAVLDSSDTMTEELLFTAINDHVAMAKDTQFQVIMNVEKGLWNASLPACTKCPPLPPSPVPTPSPSPVPTPSPPPTPVPTPSPPPTPVPTPSPPSGTCTISRGMNSNGHNLRQVKRVKSTEECCSACVDAEDCIGFTFVHGGLFGGAQCWLKDVLDELVSDSAVDSGVVDSSTRTYERFV